MMRFWRSTALLLFLSLFIPFNAFAGCVNDYILAYDKRLKSIDAGWDENTVWGSACMALDLDCAAHTGPGEAIAGAWGMEIGVLDAFCRSETGRVRGEERARVIDVSDRVGRAWRDVVKFRDVMLGMYGAYMSSWLTRRDLAPSERRIVEYLVRNFKRTPFVKRAYDQVSIGEKERNVLSDALTPEKGFASDVVSALNGKDDLSGCSGQKVSSSLFFSEPLDDKW